MHRPFPPAGFALLALVLSGCAIDLLPRWPVDVHLQAELEEAEREIAARFGIPSDRRACGVFDLSRGRLAWIRPDAIFYGASVPKICILLAYFEKHPEAALTLDAQTRRELEQMIKRSSNELAAKYSQLVGLDFIQKLQLSRKYRLYDPESGGGLWSGKHYGIDEPVTKDPVGGFSHAATVRQCLRYYLLLEQGRLVSPEACARMKEIFAAPELEFHDSSFVAGLHHRDLHLIRKSGLWENWHLDTARIEHGETVYLLAAMVHHEKGGEYLAALAAAVDDLVCGPRPPRPDRHQLILHETPRQWRAGTLRGGSLSSSPAALVFSAATAPGSPPRGEPLEYASAPVEPPRPFNEALVSWNVDVPPGWGFTVEIRVGRRFDDSWTEYLHVGHGGAVPERERRVKDGETVVDVDYLRCPKRYDGIQYRIRAFAPPEPRSPESLRVTRLALCLSDRTGIPDCRPPVDDGPSSLPPPAPWRRRLPVPFRSQRSEEPALAGRICSPTSVAMVLAYRGVERPTIEIARQVYDREHDLYGNWPRAVQTAYRHGVPGYLNRYSDWEAVKAEIARGQPLIISISASEGELTGAPYPSTSGHLLVLTGFHEDGDVCVNDPAASSEAKGRAVYRRDELEKVWMGKGGTAYVLEARAR